MNTHLVQRRTVWWPTLLGWSCLLLTACTATTLWWFQGEAFLSSTRRQPADVLVVESWIGVEGLQAAKAEFERGGYLHLVSAGGLSNNRWDQRRWSYAELGKEQLVRLGVPPDKIIVASQEDTESQRTHASAVAAWRSLHAAGIFPKAINVLTRGTHAWRSRLIFAKVFRPETEVGVVSWIPTRYQGEPWWHSSQRAEDMIKETVGCLYEVLLNSGRSSNSPAETAKRNP